MKCCFKDLEAVLRRGASYSPHARHLRTFFSTAAVTSTPSSSLHINHRHHHSDRMRPHGVWRPVAMSYSLKAPCIGSRQKQSLPLLRSNPSQFSWDRTQFLRFRSSSSSPDKEVVYEAPLKGAVRAVKVFSLTTALGSFFGGPILLWFGNPSVPLAGRAIMTSLVMLVGLGTTAILHWLVKGIPIVYYSIVN